QGSGIKDFLLSSVSAASNPGQPSPDQITHGTSMAETILRGVSLTDTSANGTPVRILPVDVYGASESTTTFDVGKGIDAALAGGATIINMSLGSAGDSPFVQQIIQSAHQQGAIFVGAAGNTPVTTPTYPAAYPEVIAVTAGDRSGQLATYANRGPFIDVMAPGADVVQYNNQAYLGQGTSFSTAYVSGVAAGLVSTTSKPLSQVEADVRRRLAYTPRP
ncbi:MAG TPA: S8 family serine peptidase, partial [Verrucomicrobiae bacterium]|nr:S8 family serine peptidase [Verrucomicrobiae bacterium]